jgi:hypothetical protein
VRAAETVSSEQGVRVADADITGSNATAVSPTLPLARFRFILEAREPISIPGYAGSAWRGLLGHGLRRLVCVTRQPICDGCLLRHTCLYSTFFETPRPPRMPERRYQSLPHPFVLEPEISPEREVPAGESLLLGITLMGGAVEQAPYLIHALNFAGGRGLGRAGGRFAVAAVEREQVLGGDGWDPVYQASRGEYERRETPVPVVPPCPPTVRVRLFTPLRIKRHGSFLGVRDFATRDFLRNLYARIGLLADLYGGESSPFDWGSVREQAEALHVLDPRLRWYEWTRFSSRQNTLMQMGGLLGDFGLAGSALSTFWSALWLGQWVHVGKGTSFGLGGYRLESAQSASP